MKQEKFLTSLRVKYTRSLHEQDLKMAVAIRTTILAVKFDYLAESHLRELQQYFSSVECVVPTVVL